MTMSYPYRQAANDYGPRQGTLGLCLHMSEGGDELVSYLAGAPARGVSANFALLTTGVMWMMLPYDHASGSLNPADRSTDKAYFGHQHLVDVLGDHWTDPNTWVISLEIAGHAATGPNPAQVAAIVVWAAEMRAMFPTLRGAVGHADQTDTKACPGTTAAMKDVFAKIGGHGLWEADVTPAPITDEAPKLVTTKAASTWYDLDGKTALSTGHAALGPRSSPYGVGTKRAIFAGSAGTRRIVLVVPGSVADVPPADCTQAVADARAAEHELVRTAAVAAAEAL